MTYLISTEGEPVLFKDTQNIDQDRPIVGHKINLNKFTGIEILQIILLGYSGIKSRNQEQKNKITKCLKTGQHISK